MKQVTGVLFLLFLAVSAAWAADVEMTGNVGVSGSISVGTTYVYAPLLVGAGSDSNIGFRDNGGPELFSSNNLNNAYTPLNINGQTVSINAYSGGDVGIGTTTPAAKLDVRGDAYISGNVTVKNGTVTADGSGVFNVNAASLNGQSSSDIISAASDEVRTAISSLPFTISTTGSYYLTGNLTSAGNGINVNVDNVTIDFNGFTITGPGKLLGAGYGIVMNGRKNVEIKDGTVRNFGLAGIAETNSSGVGHRIIRMRVQDNYDGIIASSLHNLIQDCSSISNGFFGINVGGGSILTGNTVRGNGDLGIFAGDGSIISGNTAYSNGLSGISITAGSVVKNNTAFSNQRYGIQLGDHNLVDGNAAFANNIGGGYANMNTCATCVFGINVAP